MRLTETVVRRATGEEITPLTTVVADALMVQPVGAWLVPDAAERPAVLRRYAHLVLARGLAHGQVDTTDDHAAVTVWYPRSEPPPPAATWMYDLHRRLGPHASRFALLHAYVDAVLPYTPHHHLAHVAVRPGQDRALQALLASYHRTLDAEGLPAYAELSSAHPREGVFARLGYAPRSPVLLAPGGPALWRMWRPRPGTRVPGGLPRRVRLHRSATPLRGPVAPAAPPRSP
ncbi:N-acetyltransferase [Micromonospora sp. NPDC048170]|uniref:N-acetyltransferase n=1 Tax=Micromonospora sp. NPDC048170 TaxID=3154819 RepID=UPI0034112259